jgi:hypothetical protein
MKKIAYLLILSISICSYGQKEYNVDGVIIPRNIDFLGKKLELSGFGTRSKMWMDIYVQALYLEVLSQEPEKIIDDDINRMAIKIVITSALVSSGKFTRNFNNGFERSAKENLAALQPRIELFKGFMSEKIVEKDVFNLMYNPNDNMTYVYKNNVLKGTVPGLDFKQALFGIWIGNDPIDPKLKKDLLGM